MKTVIIVIIAFSISWMSCKTQQKLSIANKVIGVYESENSGRILYMKDSYEFYLKPPAPSKMLHLVIPTCDSFIAKGQWTIIDNNGIIDLSNDSSITKVEYEIKQERKLSNDSVYIEIKLPKDDAFFNERFSYQVRFWYSGYLGSTKNILSIPKTRLKHDMIGLVVQDLFPKGESGYKSSQRFSFKVFDEYKLDNNYNYFTITLKNFNQCFVEAWDVEGDFMYFSRNKLYWNGEIYYKQ